MKPGFSFKLKLTFAQWSRAVEQGDLDEMRAYLRTVEQKMQEAMAR